MKEILLEKTYSTPYITFDTDLKILLLEGRSIPENAASFYEQLTNWIKNYFSNPKNMLEINIKLEYINSGSSKAILTIFKSLKAYIDNGAKCEINWYYEEDDESLRDLGKHFKAILKLPFNLIEDM